MNVLYILSKIDPFLYWEWRYR